MSQSTFTPTDAAEIAAAPYIARIERGEQVRAEAHRAEVLAQRHSLHGFYVEAQAPKSRDEIKAEGMAAYRRAVAFAESSRGRFLLKLRELTELGYGAEADKARAAMSRGFSDDREPASIAEVAVAIAALERVNAQDAREAVLALTEILSTEARKVA